MGARTGAGLQDHGAALGLGRLHIGDSVFPAQDHQPRHSAALGQAGRQHLCQRYQRHPHPLFELGNHVLDTGDRFDLVSMFGLEILY